jgi:hypothetical protein
MIMEVNIKMDLKEICCECWSQLLELAEDCVLWWVFNVLVFNLQVTLSESQFVKFSLKKYKVFPVNVNVVLM